MNTYHPQPINTADVELSAELKALTEQLAENVHEVWSAGRIADELRKSDVCIVLFWMTLGEYTVEELDVAVTEKQAGRKPNQVYVLFKEPAEGITEELSDFKTHFKENYPGIPLIFYYKRIANKN